MVVHQELAGAVDKSRDEAVRYWPRRIGHANLFVSDWEKSVEFYINVIGLEETYRRTAFDAGFLSNGSTHHDVAVLQMRPPSGPLLNNGGRPGLNHLAFELENEAELVVGYRRVLEWGSFQRGRDHDNTRSVYSHDPDGNGTEVYCDVIKNWRAIKSGVLTRGNKPWEPPEQPKTESYYDMDFEQRRVEHAVFHPLRCTHGVLVISQYNYEAAYTYYKDVMSLRPVLGGRESWFTAYQGALGERPLSIFRANQAFEPCFHHFGLLVADEDDLNASIERAREEGIETFADIDHPTRRSVCIRDLDGIVVQFFVERDEPLTSLEGVSEEQALYLV